VQKKSAKANQDLHHELSAAQVRSQVAEYLDIVGYAGSRIPLLDRIERLGAMIALWGSRMNLTAEAGNPQELAFHIIDSLSPVILADGEDRLRVAFRAGNRVLDLGSGAGFPGLVLASATPANFTLTESRRKRASFLASAATEMRLDNAVVDVTRMIPQRPGSSDAPASGRSNTAAQFDVVTARAFAAPSIFHVTAASILRARGIAILYANAGQNLALPHAEQHGLYEFRPMTYTIPRGSHMIARVLGLWRRR
jgi:16S rRNA (guanine(527)-N(7))-methyltransferase RsmG